MRTAEHVIATFFSLVLTSISFAQPLLDPYIYMERMVRAMEAMEGYHITVTTTESNGLGKECSRETVEAYRELDQSLTIGPNSELFVSNEAFVSVDHAKKIIELHPYGKDDPRSQPRTRPEPLLP